MLKKFILHITLILCLCLTLSTCKHEPDPNGPQCGDARTIDDMKQWVLFKQGTYWIYEEETSGALDTVIVTGYFDGVSAGGFADFSCVMHSSYDGHNYEYWFNDSYSGPSDDGCFSRSIGCSKSIPGDFFGADYVFVFPLKVGRRVGQNGGGWSSGYSTILSNNESMMVNDIAFDEVVTYNLDISVQHNWQSAQYSLAKHIGIVQKAVPRISELWTLVDFQIVQ